MESDALDVSPSEKLAHTLRRPQLLLALEKPLDVVFKTACHRPVAHQELWPPRGGEAGSCPQGQF